MRFDALGGLCGVLSRALRRCGGPWRVPGRFLGVAGLGVPRRSLGGPRGCLRDAWEASEGPLGGLGLPGRPWGVLGHP